MPRIKIDRLPPTNQNVSFLTMIAEPGVYCRVDDNDDTRFVTVANAVGKAMHTYYVDPNENVFEPICHGTWKNDMFKKLSEMVTVHFS